MAARGGRNNLIARRVIDDLIDISQERSPLKYLKIFIEQQITDHRRFIARMRDETRTSTNLISQHDEQDKVADFNRLTAIAEEKIHGKEIDLVMLEAEEIMETQAIDDQDPWVNYDNDNENDNLGYQSEEYFDEVQEDDENNHSNGNVVKKGITKLYKFLIFCVDLTVRKLAKSAAAKMVRSKSVYQHTIGRGGYALVKEKMKETEDKIKEGTLKVDHGTDAMTVVLGKEKGGYARGVGSGVTYTSDEFPLLEQLPTANEDQFPLLIQSDATAEDLCAAAEVKE
uniref:Uncharacterized protein n=1 Tax=Tanacetum cinerariifolium TaxID=118510 RepID=A0A6L2M8D9_TANCI|nr:hypothetical protein [Tanacetum cinerariifolium]